MQITGGFLNSRKIKFIASDSVRPTLSKTRQAFFNSLNSLIDFEGKIFLDMFSGSGIMALEAVSRGFEEVYAIEKDKRNARVILENFKAFKLEPNVFIGDSIKIASKLGKKFDVIFIDPPYDSDLYDKALDIIKSKGMLKANGIIVLEHPIGKNIDFKEFECIKEKEYADKKITFLSEKSD